ncbi:MAG: hypothetical protein ACOY3L_06480 [Pseudomonadota bacterium]
MMSLLPSRAFQHTAQQDRAIWPGARSPAGHLSQERPRAFTAELDRTLQRIGAARLRVTVACLTLPRDVQHGHRLAEAVAERLARNSALAGVDPDGAVLAASFGPRRFGPAGDMEEAQRLIGWFREALGHLSPDMVGRASIAVAHLWSDEWAGLAPYTRRVMFAAPLSLAGLAEAV